MFYDHHYSEPPERVILTPGNFSSKKRSNVLFEATYLQRRVSTPGLTAVHENNICPFQTLLARQLV